jgi:hypothetical protein
MHEQQVATLTRGDWCAEIHSLSMPGEHEMGKNGGKNGKKRKREKTGQFQLVHLFSCSILAEEAGKTPVEKYSTWNCPVFPVFQDSHTGRKAGSKPARRQDCRPHRTRAATFCRGKTSKN